MKKKIMSESLMESLMPEVGPFYVVDGMVYADTEYVRDIPDNKVTHTKDSNNTHYKYWRTLRSIIPEFRHMDYDYYPRGRVVYDTKNDQYRVFVDKCLDNKEAIDLIIDELNLPYKKTKVEYDEHYQCADCNPEYVDIEESYYM